MDMKRVILACGIALIALLLIIMSPRLWVAKTAFSDIAETEISSATASPDQQGELVLELSYEGAALPETSENEILIPVIPADGLVCTVERGTSLKKTKISQHSWEICAQKGDLLRTVTLTETGIGVSMLTLTGKGDHSETDPIGNNNTEAYLTQFYRDSSGNLRVDNTPVLVKLRGQTSRNFEKKSYTVTVGTSKTKVATSLMGFTADTKFAFNSMYEESSKIRDALSLSLWQKIIPESDNVEPLHFQYTELFIDGKYWGLYGFQQLVTPVTTRLSSEDGLVKVSTPLDTGSDLEQLTRGIEVIRTTATGDLAKRFASALLQLNSEDPEALELFDIDNLMHIAVYIQVLGAWDNRANNICGVWRADKGRFTLALFDTDHTFTLTGDDLQLDILTTNPNRLKPSSAVLLYGGRYKKALCELYFSLRETVFTEESLLNEARELFDLVTESGARSREKTRWQSAEYTDTNEAIENYITTRLSWCDEYFGSMLTELSGNQPD